VEAQTSKANFCVFLRFCDQPFWNLLRPRAQGQGCRLS